MPTCSSDREIIIDRPIAALAGERRPDLVVAVNSNRDLDDGIFHDRRLKQAVARSLPRTLGNHGEEIVPTISRSESLPFAGTVITSWPSCSLVVLVTISRLSKPSSHPRAGGQGS